MPELTAGDLLGGCRVEGVIARGGMGVVYRAVQLDLQRPVALKVIAAHHAEDPEFRERFGRESRMAAAIDHPNIVPVYAAGEDRGALYIVMRFVPGSDLHALIKSHRPAARRSARPRSSRRSPRRSTPRMPQASCTATSSPPTSCSPATATTPTSATSGSCARSTPTPR